MVMKRGSGFTDITLSPSDQIKRHIVQLSKECNDHLSKSEENESERFAFAMKTWVFSIMLEPYTDGEVKKMKFDHYKELEKKIKEIDNNENLSEENKNKSINSIRYKYAFPVFEQSLRVLQNSKIVEVEVEGIIDLRMKGIQKRVQTGVGGYSSGVSVSPIRKDAKELEIEKPTNEEEDKIAELPDQ